MNQEISKGRQASPTHDGDDSKNERLSLSGHGKTLA